MPALAFAALLPQRSPKRRQMRRNPAKAAPFVPHAVMAEMRALISAAGLQRYADALDGLIITHAQARALAVRIIHFRRATTHRFAFPHVV